MPSAVTELPRPEPRRKLWTRVELEALSATGLFDQQKIELIEGELIDKMGKWPAHVAALVHLMRWLTEVFGWDFIYPEGSIDVAPEDNPTNEPQPDLAVLTCEVGILGRRLPRPEEIKLLSEISDSTLGFDLGTKAGLYARAGIAEYWVLDIGGHRMFVHREPRAGRYTSVVAYNADESVAPLCAPDSPLRVNAVFIQSPA
jgi:Uma2 family endonuclease